MSAANALPLAAEIDRLRQVNAELLAMLEQLEIGNTIGITRLSSTDLRAVRAAIANAKAAV